MSNTATVITTKAGEALIAQMQAENKVLVIDKFIFANVPNRPAFPNRDDVVPVEHVVHESAVHEQGRLTENSVIYSTTLASNVGPFSFNWSGLFCSEHNVLVAINFPPPVDKTVDAPGITGNTLVRSFVLEYKGISETTNITVDPSSWQYDAHKRMSKMDNDTAQAIIDQNGKDWFIDDGFIVTPQSGAYSIKAGAGYVSGHRISLDFDRIIQVPEKPAFIYVDAFREGSPTGEWQTKYTFVVAAEEKDDYDLFNGEKHFVCKIAQILGDGSVIDLRKKNDTDENVINSVEQSTGLNIYPREVDKYIGDEYSILQQGVSAVRVKNKAGKIIICNMFPLVNGNIEALHINEMKIVVSGVSVYLTEINAEPINGQAAAFGVKPGKVNSLRLQEFFLQCDNKGWIPFFDDGIYQIGGNFSLPKYGIKGQSRFSVFFDVEDDVKGVVFNYNDVGNWGDGQGQIENISIRAKKECTASFFRVSTPSRGFLINNVGFRIGRGACVELFDSYYINFSNVAFSGNWLGRLPTVESERITGVAVKVNDREINNILWMKCDFKDLASCILGVGDVFVGSNSLQFTSCAFERIGDVCFDSRGFHAQFDSCYFEGLDQNQKLNINSDNPYHRNAMAIAGAGDLIFNNCLLNCIHVRSDDPDYAIFESVLNRIVFNSGSLGVPDNFSGKKLRDVRYSTRAVIVNNSCTGLTDINRGAYERPSQQFTNVYVDISTKSLIAASQLMADDTYAATTYRYKTYPSPEVFGFPHPIPFGLIDGHIDQQYFSVAMKARQYRLNRTTKRLGWLDIEAVFVISPDCPDYADLDDVSVKYSGDKSVFVDTEINLKEKLKVYRVRPPRTNMNEKYPFAYQIAIIGESGNDIPKMLTTEVKISCSMVDFGGGSIDAGFGIYQQLAHWTDFKPLNAMVDDQ
ncbi:phage tail protein [Photobacterium kishitanii]|uniref:phage tail-collar fiber domain-containing protein n=1 Tax=Photobacterium kishitanii TaxID=318456 RepID=UPI000D168D82|nr:phage tail protein [Photobacterium kishitanii]PSV25698.1 hypothetical protein C0W28_00425 [Photobacterium kishitanii]